MVLNKTDELLLVGDLSTQMQPNIFCTTVFKPVIELFVIAEVEALLLQFPLQVPISFSHKKKPRTGFFDRGDEINPILRRRALARAAAPSTFENLIEHQHGHVATDAVALGCNAGDRFNSCFSKVRLKCIDLQNIWPGWKERITPAGKNVPFYLDKRFRVVHCIFKSPSNKVLGMFGGPWVIWRDVVGYEIQKQLHAALCQLPPRRCETLGASQVSVHPIVLDTVWRSNIVLRFEIRQSSAEIIKQALVFVGNLYARRTSFPDSHEPNGIEPELGDCVPLGGGHGT